MFYRNIRKYYCLDGLLFVFVISLVISDSSRAGDYHSSPASYLKRGVHARALGMGQAFVGMADNSSALYWNCAGITQLEKIEISATHVNLSEDRNYEHIATVVPGKDFTWGFSWTSFGLNKIPIYNESANVDLLGFYPEISGFFEDNQNCFQFAAATVIRDLFSIGGGVKYLSQNIYDKRATGAGFDLGLFMDYTDKLKLGISFRNLFGYLQWHTDSGRKEKIPITSSLGASYRYTDYFTVNLDLVSEDSGSSIGSRIGFELVIDRTLAIRGGLDRGSPTLGFGVIFGDCTADYAFVDKDLGNVHRLSLGLTFDQNFFRKPHRKETRGEKVEPEAPPEKEKEEFKPVKIPVRKRIKEIIAQKGDILLKNKIIPPSVIYKTPTGDILVDIDYLSLNVPFSYNFVERTGTVSIKAGAIDLYVQLGNINALVNHERWITLKAAPEMIEGKIMLPILELGEYLNAPVTIVPEDIYK